MKGKIYKIKIYCRRCNSLVLVYLKEGGEPQALIKCYKDNILKDFTKDHVHCPKCGEEILQGEVIIRGRPAYKISRSKIYVRR